MNPRLAEVLGGLSLATDLAAGLAPETALRTAILTAAITRARGDSPGARHVAWTLALLRFLGCTGYAPETARMAGDGDDLRILGALAGTDAARPATVLAAAARSGRAVGVVTAARSVLTLAADPRAGQRFATAHCAQAQALAADLGVDAEVIAGLGQILERWDGAGAPDGRAGEAIHPAARVLHVAFRAEVHRAAFGAAEAIAEVRRRSGGELDPAAVSAFLDVATEVLPLLGGPSVWDTFLESEPRPAARVTDLDAVAQAFGRYADLKSGWTLGHSARVAALLDGASSDLRTAALLHDLGRCALPNALWDKPGAWSPAERARGAEHTWHTDRVLRASPATAAYADLAGRAHERLDGSGYHRGTAELSPEARRLAAADVWAGLTADRPWRPAFTRDAAAALLLDEARAGRLDRDAVDAVVEGAGLPRPRRSLPDGLTEREAEVLVLVARGLTNKEIAVRLGVSPVTVKNHVFHLYGKCGVQTRAAAALYAVRNALVE